MSDQSEKPIRKPDWLKIQLPKGDNYLKVKGILEEKGLHTICWSGKCPNMGECWNAGTATFMILGDICTRSCKFCATKTGKPLPVDTDEPEKIAQSIKRLNLKHVVITSVDRDDLPDGGSQIWANTVLKVKELNPGTTIETLVPDFGGNKDHLHMVIESRPDIISHNLETVRRLTPQIRSAAQYDPLIYQNIIPYLGGFSNYYAHAVVYKKSPADLCPGMNFYPRAKAINVRKQPREEI